MTQKEIWKIVDDTCALLDASDHTFSAIYDIMFGWGDLIVAEDDDGVEICEYTYEEIKNEIERAAVILHNKIGATNRFIGLEMENCIEWIVAFWAILRSGNKPYLINMRHPKVLIDGSLKTLGIDVIVGKEKTNLDPTFIDIVAVRDEAKDVAKDAYLPKDVFENEIALSTSATSLNEVICIYSGREISEQIKNVKGILHESKRLALHEKDRLKLLAFLPFYHIFGLTAVYFWFTFFGRTVVFMRDYAPETILDTVRFHRVTHIFAVPMLWHTIEQQVRRKVHAQGEKKEKQFEKGLFLGTKLQNIAPFLGQKITLFLMREVTEQLFGNSVKACISGGSYLRNSAMEMFNGMGYPLHNGYGMSEIGITSVELRNQPKERNLNSIGKPFESVEYRINADGVLEVRGSSLCKAFIINGERVPMNEWFVTGDNLVMKDGYYYIEGRASDLFIGPNGENINPDVIEQVFDLPNANSYCVLGLNDQLSFIVSVNAYMKADEVKQIVDLAYQANESLPFSSRIQKFYLTHDALAPETAVKVGRKLVLKKINEGTIALTPFSEIDYNHKMVAGEQMNEAVLGKVKEIVANVLDRKVDDVDEDAHILNDYGAGSLDYYAIAMEIENTFSVDGLTTEEANCYTVRAMVEFIERKRK